MAIKNEIVFDANDRTGRAFASIKNAIGDIAESGQKAQGSMGRFLQLSPQMIALGVATAGAGAVMRGVYQNSEELKGAASRLGVAWDSLMSSMAKSEIVTKTSDGIRALAESMTLLADKPKEVATFATDSVLELSRGIGKLQDQIATKSNYGSMAFWLPSVSDLHAQLDALADEVTKKSIETNKLISDLRKKGLDPTEFVQLNDAAWSSIIFRSEKAFEEIKKQENDSKKHKQDVIKAYEKAFADSLDEQSKLNFKYTESAIDVAAILEFNKRPETKKRVNEILLQLDQKYLDESAALIAKNPEGPVSPNSSQLDKNKSSLDFLGGDSRATKAQEQLAFLVESLRTEEQVIADSYAQRQFIVESAFQEGSIPTLAEYNALSTELWAENEAEKSRILEQGIATRTAIQQQSHNNELSLASSFFGGLSALLSTQGKKAFDASKIAALSEAAISMWLSVEKAYASQILPGDPTSIFRAVAAGAAAALYGAANIARISSTSYGGGGGGGSPGGSSFGGGGGNSSTPTGASGQAQAQSQAQDSQKAPIVIQINVNGSILTDTTFNEVLRENLSEYFNNDGVLVRRNTAQGRELIA